MGDDVKTMELTVKNVNILQDKYDNAVKKEDDVFEFNGETILTKYAKYLLEYVKDDFKRRGINL